MKNRIQSNSNVLVTDPGEVLYRYTGTIVGHFVAGEIMLPSQSWAARAGMLRLYADLHEGSGLDFDLMEKESDVQWERA